MKTLYLKIKFWGRAHCNQGLFYLSLLLLMGIASICFAKIHIIFAQSIVTSAFSIISLVIYKKGYVPLGVRDFGWDIFRVKNKSQYTQEELEEQYKEISLSRATVLFIISLFSYFTGLALELLIFFL